MARKGSHWIVYSCVAPMLPPSHEGRHWSGCRGWHPGACGIPRTRCLLHFGAARRSVKDLGPHAVCDRDPLCRPEVCLRNSGLQHTGTVNGPRGLRGPRSGCLDCQPTAPCGLPALPHATRSAGLLSTWHGMVPANPSEMGPWTTTAGSVARLFSAVKPWSALPGPSGRPGCFHSGQRSLLYQGPVQSHVPFACSTVQECLHPCREGSTLLHVTDIVDQWEIAARCLSGCHRATIRLMSDMSTDRNPRPSIR